MLSSVVLGVLLSLLILLTVGGNVLVCLAVCASRRLRCLTNCFIVSLAATDLLLGLLVLPFSALLQLSGEWPLGPAFCNFYISMDVMLCTASILTLLVISVDRYLAVTMPLRYASLVLPWRVAVAMAGVWTVSVAVSFLPIQMGWNTINGTVQNRGPGSRERKCRFELNGPYVLTDSLLTFYLPLIVMCWTYFRILLIARTQAKRIISARPTCIASYDCGGASPSATNTLVSSAPAATLREHKAAVTLAALIGAFVVCWLPYFILFTALGLKEHPDPSSVPEYSIVLWLGYANSALNPILYGALNKDFRTAYARLLRCRCPSHSGCSCRPSPNLPAGNAAGKKGPAVKSARRESFLNTPLSKLLWQYPLPLCFGSFDPPRLQQERSLLRWRCCASTSRPCAQRDEPIKPPSSEMSGGTLTNDAAATDANGNKRQVEKDTKTF